MFTIFACHLFKSKFSAEFMVYLHYQLQSLVQNKIVNKFLMKEWKKNDEMD